MRWVGVLGVTLALGCAGGRSGDGADFGSDGDGDRTTSDSATSTTGGTAPSTTGGSADGSGSSTGSPLCECAPGTDVIHVISDAGELVAYDPIANTFASLGVVDCGGFDPFSLAVDRSGQAWLLLLDDIPFAVTAKGLFTVDLANTGACTPVPYTEGIFGAFGMSFVSNTPPDTCERLFVHSYSGDGPFAEGAGIGNLGRLNEDSGVLESLAEIDFDGGELAGTGDGRLYAFAGSDPAKLVEYDKDDGTALSVTPLDGLEKTGASAVAFYGGDFYFFTESAAVGCRPCLEMNCSGELAACEADPGCPDVLACLLAAGGEAPGCQGDIVGPGGPLRDCMLGSCAAACSTDVVSKVTHFDFDDSDASGQALTVVEEFAPVRIVGAGASTCVPVNVP